MMGQIKHVHVYAQGLEKKVQSLEKARVEAERKEGRNPPVSNKILQGMLADKEQVLQNTQEELRLLKEKVAATSCKVEPTSSDDPSELRISRPAHTVAIPDARTPLELVEEPFPILEQNVARVTFGQMMANREFWREAAHDWQCQFTKADTKLQVIEDHHSALIKEKDNVVQAQLAQIQLYQHCYPSYPGYHTAGASYGDTSDLTSDVMTGGDPELSLASPSTPMEVANNAALREDAELAAATMTLQLINSEPSEGPEGTQQP
ncbi:MAG: hypothetical protein GY697_23765 [Desulfobacterales bacterium]|nr:hypothetical protein [Desulfobacterales bacterium]